MKFEYNEENITHVMQLIRNNLTSDLIKQKHRDQNKRNPMYGHCKHASEALVELMNTDQLCLMRSKTHVWVQDGIKIYDITVDQYHSMGLNPSYNGQSYSDMRMSIKTKELVNRVLHTSSTSGTEGGSEPPEGCIITR